MSTEQVYPPTSEELTLYRNGSCVTAMKAYVARTGTHPYTAKVYFEQKFAPGQRP